MNKLPLSAMLLLAALLAGCATSCPLPGTKRMTETRLYFGRGIPGGGTVSDADWAAFAATSLTPAFPDGFTTYQTQGQWRNPADGTIGREQSFVVEIDGPLTPAKIDSVTTAYKTRFHQQAVGITTSPICAAF